MKKLYILLATPILVSCGILQKQGATVANSPDRLVNVSNVAESAAKTNAAAQNINGEWTLVKSLSVDLEDLSSKSDEPSTITFNIGDNGTGTFYCYTGCNYMNGNVVLSGDGSIKLTGSFLSTCKACDDESEAAEKAVKQSLAEMRRYVISNENSSNILYLMNSAGEKLLTGRRSDISFINGAWEVAWLEDKLVETSSGLQLVIDLPARRIHGNTGCNIVNGTVRIIPEVSNGIEITDLATTMRGCPEPEATLERELLLALENVESCAIIETSGNEAALLDSQGKTVIKLHRMNLKK